MDFRKYERGYAEIQPNNKLNTGFNVRKNENIPVYKWDYLKKRTVETNKAYSNQLIKLNQLASFLKKVNLPRLVRLKEVLQCKVVIQKIIIKDFFELQTTRYLLNHIKISIIILEQYVRKYTIKLPHLNLLIKENIHLFD